VSELHRIKIADLEGNFLYLNVRRPHHEVLALVALINGPTNGACRYERQIEKDEAE
jgi:hypothetical protein